MDKEEDFLQLPIWGTKRAFQVNEPVGCRGNHEAVFDGLFVVGLKTATTGLDVCCVCSCMRARVCVSMSCV